MLSDEITEKLTERLVNRIEKANLYVLKKIAKNIKKIGNVKPSDAYKLQQILKYGGDYNKIVEYLSKVTELNVKDIKKIFHEVAKKNYQFAENFYKYRNIEYIPYEKNIPLQNQVEALANITSNEYRNISQNLVFTKKIKNRVVYNNLHNTYNEVIDKAIISVSEGKINFQEEMYSAIKELSSSGIKTVNYASGRKVRLDSAIRMHMKEGLKNLQNKLQLRFGKEFNADGVEISVHLYPAPDHAQVQGRQFSNEEFNKFQNDEDAVSYDNIKFPAEFNGHDRRSISQYNCYHKIFSIVLGVSNPEYTKEQLQEMIDNNNNGFEYEGKHYTMYEGTQLQRKLELEIRKLKDEQIMAKESGITEDIGNTQKKITILTNKYRELSKISKLPVKMQRMRVSGYRRTKVNS